MCVISPIKCFCMRTVRKKKKKTSQRKTTARLIDSQDGISANVDYRKEIESSQFSCLLE